MIKVQELEEKLEKLTGNDIEEVEKMSRKLGNSAPVITTSSDFRSRLAARALNMNVHELRSLPAREYNLILSTVLNFLYSYTDEMEVESRASN